MVTVYWFFALFQRTLGGLPAIVTACLIFTRVTESLALRRPSYPRTIRPDRTLAKPLLGDGPAIR
jgi:hypothetical protein